MEKDALNEALPFYNLQVSIKNSDWGISKAVLWQKGWWLGPFESRTAELEEVHASPPMAHGLSVEGLSIYLESRWKFVTLLPLSPFSVSHHVLHSLFSQCRVCWGH